MKLNEVMAAGFCNLQSTERRDHVVADVPRIFFNTPMFLKNAGILIEKSAGDIGNAWVRSRCSRRLKVDAPSDLAARREGGLARLLGGEVAVAPDRKPATLVTYSILKDVDPRACRRDLRSVPADLRVRQVNDFWARLDRLDRPLGQLRWGEEHV